MKGKILQKKRFLCVGLFAAAFCAGLVGFIALDAGEVTVRADETTVDCVSGDFVVTNRVYTSSDQKDLYLRYIGNGTLTNNPGWGTVGSDIAVTAVKDDGTEVQGTVNLGGANEIGYFYLRFPDSVYGDVAQYKTISLAAGTYGEVNLTEPLVLTRHTTSTDGAYGYKWTTTSYKAEDFTWADTDEDYNMAKFGTIDNRLLSYGNVDVTGTAYALQSDGTEVKFSSIWSMKTAKQIWIRRGDYKDCEQIRIPAGYYDTADKANTGIYFAEDITLYRSVRYTNAAGTTQKVAYATKVQECATADLTMDQAFATQADKGPSTLRMRTSFTPESLRYSTGYFSVKVYNGEGTETTGVALLQNEETAQPYLNLISQFSSGAFSDYERIVVPKGVYLLQRAGVGSIALKFTEDITLYNGNCTDGDTTRCYWSLHAPVTESVSGLSILNYNASNQNAVGAFTLANLTDCEAWKDGALPLSATLTVDGTESTVSVRTQSGGNGNDMQVILSGADSATVAGKQVSVKLTGGRQFYPAIKGGLIVDYTGEVTLYRLSDEYWRASRTVSVNGVEHDLYESATLGEATRTGKTFVGWTIGERLYGATESVELYPLTDRNLTVTATETYLDSGITTASDITLTQENGVNGFAVTNLYLAADAGKCTVKKAGVLVLDGALLESDKPLTAANYPDAAKAEIADFTLGDNPSIGAFLPLSSVYTDGNHEKTLAARSYLVVEINGTEYLCYNEATVSVAAIDHVYGEEQTHPSTCTEAGYTYHACTVCGHSENTGTLPLAGHTYGEEQTHPSTCTEAGYTYHVCTVCGHSENTGALPLAQHTYGEEQTVDSTCTEEGYTYHVCTVCGHSENTGVIEKKAHTPSDWIVDKEATEEETGSRHKECTVCHETLETEEIPLVKKKGGCGGVAFGAGGFGVAAIAVAGALLMKKRKERDNAQK